MNEKDKDVVYFMDKCQELAQEFQENAIKAFRLCKENPSERQKAIKKIGRILGGAKYKLKPNLNHHDL